MEPSATTPGFDVDPSSVARGPATLPALAVSSPSLAALSRHRGWSQVEQSVAEADEMLEFSWRDGGDLESAVLEYFVSGERVAHTVLQAARQWFDGLDTPEAQHTVLDFGGGYGRVTRFLASALGASRVYSSDLLPGAVRFAREVLRVNAFASAAQPEELEAPRRFDVIYAGSLFTHLPESTFDRWLARLLDLLEPGGLLIFSVHGADLLPPEIEMPSSGFFFRASSESHEIDHASYGSTWITELALAERVTAAGAVARHFERGLCGYQDLVLATRDAEGATRLSEVAIDPGARTQIERCELHSSVREGRAAARVEMELSGWAIPGAQQEHVGAVTISLSPIPGAPFEVLGSTDSFQWRAELVEPLELVAGQPAGWQLSVDLPVPLNRGQATLLVEVASQARPEAPPPPVNTVAYAGSVDRLLYLSTRENYLRHRQRVYELAEIIEAMKESFFWGLRRRWFVVKKALRLTQEDPAGPPITATDRRPE